MAPFSRGAEFRINSPGRNVYLTFDDGPIPEATPFVLDVLRDYDVKATFFMVGDNARKYPELVERVHACGHGIGNHSMHHLQGLFTSTEEYLADVAEAEKYLPETNLFRPPHGLMRHAQLKALRQKYRIILFDLVTRDYSSRVDAAGVLSRVKQMARPGSIIVFHDSLRSIAKLKEVLPSCLDFLIKSDLTPRVI